LFLKFEFFTAPTIHLTVDVKAYWLEGMTAHTHHAKYVSACQINVVAQILKTPQDLG